jgi:hypothetical protein
VPLDDAGPDEPDEELADEPDPDSEAGAVLVFVESGPDDSAGLLAPAPSEEAELSAEAVPERESVR